MLRLHVFIAFLSLSLCLAAQSPTPAPAQKGAVLILGATAHLGNGTSIPVSAVAFDKGKITLVADATTIRIDRNQYQKIYDASGKHLYPGFIAPNSQLGLVEVEAVRATNDQSEIGSYNPNARAIVAYNTDSEVTPTVRSNGILMAQVCPQGGVLSGSSSVVQLDAWNWEDAAVRRDAGQHLNWPAPRTVAPGEESTYGKETAAIAQYFREAEAYCKIEKQEVKNPRFEAMRGLFSGQQILYIHANQAKSIRDAVHFGVANKVKIVIVGGDDAWQETTLLKTHNVPVVLNRTQRLPSREDEDVDQPYKTARMLQEAGVTFSFSDGGSWKQRNLAFEAGQAVGAGLPYEAAVSALTLNTAKILGIDTEYGSLEQGKSATLFISEGDALDMRTNKVTAAFINGREIDLDNKQKVLNRKYSEKYKPGLK